MTDRHSIRATWHDYKEGIYFITICTGQKQHLLGRITNSEMHFSPEGEIISNCLKAIPDHHKNVEIWNSVIMPNHIHMILHVGAQYFAPASSMDITPASILATTNVGCIRPPRHGIACTDNHFNSSVAIIVRTFKAACSTEINRYRRAQNIAPLQLWQRNYHEHIIRDQHAFDKIMEYIDNNVANWSVDCFY